MKTVTLGTTGMPVSAICLGTMRFGTKTDATTSVAILDEYVAAGGSFLDTANVYAAWEPGAKGGESEKLLGRWLRERGHRDQIVLATKIGSRYQQTGFGLRAAQIEEECNGCLQRLGVETVDLLYAHFDDRDTPLEETLAAFDKLRQAGKVRFLGASNHRVWRLEQMRTLCALHGWAGYCCVQQRYSFAQPVTGSQFGMQIATNDDLLDYCAARGLTLLAYSPLLGGVYGGRPDRALSPAYQNVPNEQRLKALRSVAAAKGVTPNQLVLAWLLHHTPPVIPIAAASSVAQMRENLAALTITLSADEMQVLNGQGKQP